ncbi:MAG TPA: TPM domain-containing protein [Halomicronema sp.]
MQIRSLTLSKSITTTLVTLTFISLPATALTVEEVPNSRRVNGGWVTDMANILTPQTEAQLNQMISQLEAKNGSEIAVVTVPDTAPSATPKQFATELFNHLKVGKVGNNNGVLLLISTGNRRVEIETGTGLQSILPNVFVSNIIKQEITPKFKQNDYNGGTLAGTKALVVSLENYQSVNNGPVTSLPLGETQPVPVQIFSNFTASDRILFALVCVTIFLVIFVIIFITYRLLRLIYRLIFKRQKNQKKVQLNEEYSEEYNEHLTPAYQADYELNESVLNTYINRAKESNCSSSESNNSSDCNQPSKSHESNNSWWNSNNWWSSDNSSSSDTSSSSSYESSSSDYGGGSSSSDGGGGDW